MKLKFGVNKYQSTNSSTISGHTSHHQRKNCHRAGLSASADFADIKKTKSFYDSKNEMTELKNHLKPLTNMNG